MAKWTAWMLLNSCAECAEHEIFYLTCRTQGQPVPCGNRMHNGNAWFVDKVQYVNNANEEIDALNDILPTEIAVVDVKFKEKLKGVTEGYKDSLSAIRLTS